MRPDLRPLADQRQVGVEDPAALGLRPARPRGPGTGRRTRPSTADRRAGSAGRCRPRAIAPSTASVSACRPASASEWPTRPWSWAIRTPHSQTASPGPKRWASMPEAGAHDPPRAGQLLGHGEVLRVGQLHQHRVARRPWRTRPPARSTTAASSVGSSPAGQAAVGGLQPAEAEGLRGLGAPEALAADRLGRPGPRRASGCRATGRAGTAPSAPLQRRQQALDVGAGHEGPGGVVHQHRLVAPRSSAPRGPPAPNRARVVPPADRAPAGEARQRLVQLRPAGRAATTTTTSRAPARAAGLHRPAQRSAAPPSSRQALGSPGPARRPSPAATTIAREAHRAVFRAAARLVQFAQALLHRTICLKRRRWG